MIVKYYILITAKLMNIKVNEKIFPFVNNYFSNISIIFKLFFYFLFLPYFFIFILIFPISFLNSEKIIRSLPIFGEIFRFFKTLILLKKYDG
jgi:hypothetical protein